MHLTQYSHRFHFSHMVLDQLFCTKHSYDRTSRDRKHCYRRPPILSSSVQYTFVPLHVEHTPYLHVLYLDWFWGAVEIFCDNTVVWLLARIHSFYHFLVQKILMHVQKHVSEINPRHYSYLNQFLRPILENPGHCCRMQFCYNYCHHFRKLFCHQNQN